MNTELILQKLKSLKLNLEVHPENEPNSEFEDRINVLDEIINKLKEYSDINILISKGIIMKLEYWEKRFEEIDAKANIKFIINEEKRALSYYKKMLKNAKK